MFPESFIKRITLQKYLNAEELISALKISSPVSVRINRGKWNHLPVNSDPVPWCPDGHYLESRPSYTLDPLFHSGCYYPQEASGMFLEQVFRQAVDNKGYIKILDLCGAPGGKSTHISSLLGNEGLLVANEVIKPRANTLAENLTKWGLSNCIVTQNDPSAFNRLTGFFDVILVDAPCSGEGMFRDKIAINEWSEENTSLCADRQRRILMDVWLSLKENGILIYSTCTFNQGENEENIKWLTSRHEAESIELDISDFEGITEIDFQGIHGYGFYPGRIRGDGLFVAVLRKCSEEKAVKAGESRFNFQKINKEEKLIVCDWTTFPDESFFKSGDDIYSAPGNLSDHNLISKNLRVIKPGTRILTIKGRNNIPSPELAMSVFYRKESLPFVNVSLESALQYLHRGNFIAGAASKGWNTVLYNDVPLGFINNIGTRVNNYYPVGWRIRMNIPVNAKESIITWD
jgi:16S rRNA C967 or C1407 C5-methylase (RsmB/RsmF family)/NOL1/NOP2/fmu family ribosome biogenesis protein